MLLKENYCGEEAHTGSKAGCIELSKTIRLSPLKPRVHLFGLSFHTVSASQCYEMVTTAAELQE